jgi:hypothetical protein
MRCLSCNRILSPQALTFKYVESKEPVDLCSRCITGTGILFTKNASLPDDVDDSAYEPDAYDEALGG